MVNNQLKLLFIAVIVLVLSGYLFWQGFNSLPEPSIVTVSPTPILKDNILGERIARDSTISATASGSLTLKEYHVTKVTDGDTIEVQTDYGKRKVRYIGVNTPETVDPRRADQCFGKQASIENKNLVGGKSVILEKDISDTDKFDRLLRYVYLRLPNGQILFVNDYLVRQGYAYADTYPPDVKYSERFLQAQQEAKLNKRGLWLECS